VLHVEGQGANLLDGIDAEQHAPLATALAQAGKVQAQAAGELHGTDRQQPGARATGLEQRGLGVIPGQAGLDHIDALIRQCLPDHAIGRELLVADDHLVAALPVEAEGNQ
jgi:hypothetical protein